MDVAAVATEFGRDLTKLVVNLEGPYKWYAIGVAAMILTGIVTRFIFRTLKWFLLIALAGAILLAGLWWLLEISGL